MILSSLRTKLVTCFLLASIISHAQLEYPTGTLNDDALYDSDSSYNLEEFSISLPKTYSLNQFVPKVGNQLDYPHDIAWSIASATTIVESVYTGRFDKSNTAKLLKSPYFINMLWANEKDVCSEPISLQQTIYKMSNTGIPLFREYINFCPKDQDEELLKKGETLPIFKFDKVFDREMTDKEKIQRMKVKIALDRPIVMSFHCPPSFVSAKDFWSPKELMNEEFPLHTVVIIGYDDEIYGGAFLILNSWSKRWGNDGFMWIRYQDVEFMRYAYSVTYQANEGDNLSILGGDLNFKNTDTKESIPFVQFNPKGYYQFDVGKEELKFALEGTATKPFYIKMYYKSEGEVTQIYPLEKWRSSLFEYSFDGFTIPGKDNFYQIEEDIFSSLFIFISLEDIDDFDFSELVNNSEDIIDVLRSQEFDFSRQVVWDNERTGC